MLKSLLISLALTLVTELCAARIFGIKKGTDLAVVGLVNVVTNPPLVTTMLWVDSVAPPAVYLYRAPIFALLEITAVLIEAVIYRYALTYKKIRPLLLSLILNSVSFLSGEIINILIRK